MATQSKVAQNPLLVWYRLRLQARPLQTKMFTAATFMALGEILAGNFSGMTAAQAQLLGARARKGVDSASDLMADVRHWLISHGLNGRAGKMFLYGLLINAPMGHYLTAQLQRAFAGHTSFRAKIAQIVTANLTVSVLANVVNLVCMAYINGARSVQGVVLAVKTNFWKVMRIAWTTNPISIAIAQSYLPLELWEPFFIFVRFAVGVWINTITKKKQMQLEDLRKETKHLPPPKGLPGDPKSSP